MDAAWGWSAGGWLTIRFGFHDAIASGVVHGVAGHLHARRAPQSRAAHREVHEGRDGAQLPRPQHAPHADGAHAHLHRLLRLLRRVPLHHADGLPGLAQHLRLADDARRDRLRHHRRLRRRVHGRLVREQGRSVLDAVRRPRRRDLGLRGRRRLPPVARVPARDLGRVRRRCGSGNYIEKRLRIDDAVGAVAVHGVCGFYGVFLVGIFAGGYPTGPRERRVLDGRPADGDHGVHPARVPARATSSAGSSRSSTSCACRPRWSSRASTSPSSGWTSTPSSSASRGHRRARRARGRQRSGPPRRVLADERQGAGRRRRRRRGKELGDVRRVPVRRVERGHRRLLDVRPGELDRHVHPDRARDRGDAHRLRRVRSPREPEARAPAGDTAGVGRARQADRCRPGTTTTIITEETMAGKQIDFPPLQKENSRVAPFMLILSILCIVIVAIILATDVFDGRGSGRGRRRVADVDVEALSRLRDLQQAAGGRTHLGRRVGKLGAPPWRRGRSPGAQGLALPLLPVLRPAPPGLGGGTSVVARALEQRPPRTAISRNPSARTAHPPIPARSRQR